jgi:hypothetical protein
LKPLEISSGDALKRRPVDWLGISHAVFPPSPQGRSRECYLLGFYSESGELLDVIACDSLDLAIDQGHAIAEVRPDEWQECLEILIGETPVLWSSGSNRL